MGKTIGELVRSSDTDGMLIDSKIEGILTGGDYRRLRLLMNKENAIDFNFDGSVVLSGNNIKLQSTDK